MASNRNSGSATLIAVLQLLVKRNFLHEDAIPAVHDALAESYRHGDDPPVSPAPFVLSAYQAHLNYFPAGGPSYLLTGPLRLTDSEALLDQLVMVATLYTERLTTLPTNPHLLAALDEVHEQLQLPAPPRTPKIDRRDYDRRLSYLLHRVKSHEPYLATCYYTTPLQMACFEPAVAGERLAQHLDNLTKPEPEA